MDKSRVHKHVSDLTEADLDEHGIWEFAIDEEGEDGSDETTVRPCKADGLLDPLVGMFVVRARMRLADGTQIQGYLSPPAPGHSGLESIQPVVVSSRGQVCFWCGTLEPEPEDLVESYARLGKLSASQVFPLRFESVVPLIGGPITGEVTGFLVLEDVHKYYRLNILYIVIVPDRVHNEQFCVF